MISYILYILSKDQILKTWIFCENKETPTQKY